MSQKPTNPKDALAITSRIPLHLFPQTAVLVGAIAMLDGALKYGRHNFRAGGARASVYADAARSHLNKWFEGEENDPATGVPHLGYALACIAILVDCQANGNLTDDRMMEGPYMKMVEALTPKVMDLHELHHEKRPHHFTIKDNKRKR